MSRLESIEARLAEIEKELSGDDAEGKTEEDLAKIEEEVMEGHRVMTYIFAVPCSAKMTFKVILK